MEQSSRLCTSMTYIFFVGLKRRYDAFRDELNRMVPVKNFGELRWYGGCHYTREREMGTLTISQKKFADELVKRFCVTSTKRVFHFELV